MTLHLPMSVQDIALAPLYHLILLIREMERLYDPIFTYERPRNGTGAPVPRQDGGVVAN